ncbi:klotho [Polypterus senegalus]
MQLYFLVYVCWLQVPSALGHPGDGERTWLRFDQMPQPEDELFLYDTFPPDFVWAVGTAAYQVEGAFEKDGKGPSIWDRFTHRGNGTSSNGDEASDSYHQLQRDIHALSILGVTHYRFSISWPRVFPTGRSDSYNHAGVSYYRGLLNQLKKIRVQPVVTLYHWDLPDDLQRQYGGWSNPVVIELFKEYADFCFRTFGEDVKYWITIDNPFVVAWHGYGTGIVAPGIRSEPSLPFRVGHNLLKAHAAVWHLYNDKYRQKQQGQVSISLGSHGITPLHLTKESIKACQCSLSFVLGWFAKPLFNDGDYPQCMKVNLSSNLPSFTEDEKKYVNNTVDFFALSFGPVISFQLINDSLRFGQSETLNLRILLSWIKAEYNSPRVFIVENGWFVEGGTKTEDAINMYYIKRFVAETLKAIKYDKVNVIGYTAWSLVDGFEWYREYDIRRGLFYVDFTSPDLRRIQKTSGLFYQKLIEKNGFPVLPENEPISGVFPCNFSWGVATNAIRVDFARSQFNDPNVYIWENTSTMLLKKVDGVTAPMRKPHCSDYDAIKQQVSQVRRMHVTHFNFPLNWTALVPNGNLSQANSTLFKYYRCFTSELLRANVTPIVTLWHWTESDPGWLGIDNVQPFADYARLCFQKLGDLVKFWITLNEPNTRDRSFDMGHTLLKAHASAWHIYDKDFREEQNGKISITLHANWIESAYPFTRNDGEPATRVLEFSLGWFSEPIFGSGDYPTIMRDWVQQRNHLDLYNHRLPFFTKEEKELVHKSFDFFALSHYTTALVSEVKNEKVRSNDITEVVYLSDSTWLKSPKNMPVVPWGLRKVLNWVKSKYENVPVYIMANGIDVENEKIEDKLRLHYHHQYINEALKAYLLDGVNLQGYFAYAFSDQTDPGFGLYGYIHDEYYEKLTLGYYRSIIDQNGFPASSSVQQKCASEQESCRICALLLTNRSLLAMSLVGVGFTLTTTFTICYLRRLARRYHRA